MYHIREGAENLGFEFNDASRIYGVGDEDANFLNHTLQNSELLKLI